MATDDRPEAATNGHGDPENDANLWIHARCHVAARVVAFIAPDNRLTIACGECWKPIVTVQDHHGMFAGIRAMGCQAGVLPPVNRGGRAMRDPYRSRSRGY